MKTIFRYSLPVTDMSVVLMPAGAEVLPDPPSARNSDSEVEVWAVVDSDAPLERRSFRIVGTGNPMPGDCGRFIGTVLASGGLLVWHLFEAIGVPR